MWVPPSSVRAFGTSLVRWMALPVRACGTSLVRWMALPVRACGTSLVRWMALQCARSAATRLFGRWHHNTDWQMRGRASLK